METWNTKSMFWVALMTVIAKSYKSPANQEGTCIFQNQTYPVKSGTGCRDIWQHTWRQGSDILKKQKFPIAENTTNKKMLKKKKKICQLMFNTRGKQTNTAKNKAVWKGRDFARQQVNTKMQLWVLSYQKQGTHWASPERGVPAPGRCSSSEPLLLNTTHWICKAGRKPA